MTFWQQLRRLVFGEPRLDLTKVKLPEFGEVPSLGKKDIKRIRKESKHGNTK